MGYKYGDILHLDYRGEVDSLNIEYDIIDMEISMESHNEWDHSGYTVMNHIMITIYGIKYRLYMYNRKLYGFDNVTESIKLGCKYTYTAIFITELPPTIEKEYLALYSGWRHLYHMPILHSMRIQFYTTHTIKDQYKRIFIENHDVFNKWLYINENRKSFINNAIPLGSFELSSIQYPYRNIWTNLFSYHRVPKSNDYILFMDNNDIYIYIHKTKSDDYYFKKICSISNINKLILENTPKYKFSPNSYTDIIVRCNDE